MKLHTEAPTIFFMAQGDHISTAQTGDHMSSRSQSDEINPKTGFGGSEAVTPRSSVYSGEISQTSSALGRLMEYVLCTLSSYVCL